MYPCTNVHMDTCTLLFLTFLLMCLAVPKQSVIRISTNQFLHRSRKNQTIDEVYIQTALCLWPSYFDYCVTIVLF